MPDKGAKIISIGYSIDKIFVCLSGFFYFHMKGIPAMNIQLSDHFTYAKIIRFTLPSIIMMIFTSIYSVVDGFFISNFVGITEFAAINLIMPVPMLLGCLGFMFGAGGSALVGKTLGENDSSQANRTFSLLVYVGIFSGIVLSILGILLIEPITHLLGADEAMLPHCIIYGRILLIALPVFLLQHMFQSFLVTAEKPMFGLLITILAGITNIVLDALFILVFQWGIIGAAVATILAQFVGGFIPLLYFARPNSSLLQLGRTHYNSRIIFSTCTNGSSELVTNVSMSCVAILYNLQLMKFAAENGVAAYGAIMYVSFIFVAVFLGYSLGIAPAVSFHYGANNTHEIKNLLQKSNILIAATSIMLALIAYNLASPLAQFFLGIDATSYNSSLIELTADAFHFYAISLLFIGFSIFGSTFFTALNNGYISAAISFLRTFVFQIISVLTLPIFFGIDGVWYSLFLSEILSTAVTFYFIYTLRTKYRY